MKENVKKNLKDILDNVFSFIFNIILICLLLFMTACLAMKYGADNSDFINDNFIIDNLDPKDSNRKRASTDYDDGYNDGYSDGVYNASNTLSNFDETTLNTLYYTDTDRVVNDANISFPINGYIYDFNNEVSVLKSDRLYNGDGKDSGECLFVLNDISPILSTSLDFISIGFFKVELIYTDSTLEFFNISDYRSNITLTPVKEKLLNSIALFFNANLDLVDYSLSLFDKNNYLNGYQNGYSDGVENGKNDVLNNPNNYDLYTQIDINELKEIYYNQGYDKGVLEGEGLGERGFLTMFNAILNAPFNILNGMLNFEIFGINLFNLITFILTVGLIIFLFALFGGKFSRK